MKIWLTTDTHFGHDKLVEYNGRPRDFTVQIYRNLKAVLHDDALLIHLGDVCMGRDEQNHAMFIQTLPGKKILVRGNHDRKSNNWYLNHGWDFVCERFADQYFNTRILFSHIPVSYDNWYDMNIHGHFHNSDHRSQEAFLLAIKNQAQKLLALEYTNYKPVLLEEFIKPDVNPWEAG